MWSVPYNLNLHDTYMGIAMVYNRQDKKLFVAALSGSTKIKRLLAFRLLKRQYHEIFDLWFFSSINCPYAPD
jgi:hypothetical protein